MSVLVHWFTPDVLRTLGLSLLHFLWQGAALATLTTAALAISRRASTRYIIAVLALVLMVAAPVVTFSFLRQTASPVATSAPTAIPAMNAIVNHKSPPAVLHAQGRTVSLSLLTAFVELWFVGVFLFSLRMAGGFFLVARLRRRESHPVGQGLLALAREMQHRLGITRAIRYCQSLQLDAPAVIGWFRPVLLLPISALTGLNELQLRAVIAHELAHIRRCDAFFNLFQVAAETLLFYHPAVWWLSNRIRVERENCCDDVALAVCGNPAEYARALALMEQWRAAPSFAMAANRGPLASRVTRLLGLAEKGSSLRNAGLAFGVLCLAAALLAGNALFGLVRAAAAQSPKTNPDHFAAKTTADKGAIIITASRITPHSAPVPKMDSSSLAEQSTARDVQSAAPKSQSYIDGLKAEGLENLDADQLIALKIQGVTPQYIHEIRAEGLKPSVDELVGMKVQGITPDYIHQVRAMNLKADIESLIGMKVQGITPQYVDEMRKLGFTPDTNQLIGMKVQGITSEYVDQMRKLGFKPDVNQLIGMKVQGINPEYIRQLNELNIHPDVEDLIGMKVQGIDANYVRSIRATGLTPDKDQWIALKVQGVTDDFIKSLQAAGFKPNVDQIVGAKVQGITPQFIELARSKGFKNLDLDKLIQLKHANVLE
jgi:beta-lactamase regulating signal transducer with metallopeptidase domain